MYNVAIIKHIVPAALFVAAMPWMVSCGGGSGEEAEAQAMLTSAKQLVESNLLDSSIAVTDSLCRKFPSQIEIVKEAMHLKATTLKQKFTLELAQADSIIAVQAPTVQSIAGKFKVVKTPEMIEGYRVLKSLAGTQLLNTTSIEPRVDDGGNIYIVSLLHGHAAQHDHLIASVKGGASETTDTIPYDKARNYRFSDGGVSNEMVTFHYDECDRFCQFIIDNADKAITLTFKGRSSYSMPLSDKLKQAIVESFSYSKAMQTGLKAEHDKLLLTRKLEIANKQVEQTKLQ